MALPPMLLHTDADCVVARWHNAVMTRWMGRVHIEAIEQAFAVGQQLAREYDGRVVSVSLVENGLTIPSAEVRRRAAGMMTIAEDYMVFQATIMAGRTFWNRAARAALAGMIFLTRGTMTSHVYGSIDEAAEDILQYIEAEDLTAAGVVHAISALR